MKSLAIAFAVTDPAGGVAYYRGAAPANLLRERGHTVVVSDAVQMTPLGRLVVALELEHERPVAWEPDVLVLTGGWPTAIPLEWIAEARAEGQVVVVDLDDWPYLPADNFHAELELPTAKRAAVQAASACTASTPYLAARIMKSFRRDDVHVCRNVADPRMYHDALAVNNARLLSRRDADALVVGFRGGMPWHRVDATLIARALRELDATGRVRFVHVGHLERVARTGVAPVDVPTFAGVTQLPDAHVTRRPHVPFRDYPSSLGGIDVAVIPLSSRPFSLAKSCIGGLEWSAAGVPWLASPTPEYHWLDAAGCVEGVKSWVRRVLELESVEARTDAFTRQSAAAAELGLFANVEHAGDDWARVLHEVAELGTRSDPSAEEGPPPDRAAVAENTVTLETLPGQRAENRE